MASQRRSPLLFLVAEVVNLNLAHYSGAMAWERCQNCNQEFFKRKGNEACPNCSVVFASEKPSKSSEELLETLVEQAGRQAKVVDKFGEILQILGYICIAIFLISLTVSLFTKNWIEFVIFLVAIPLTFVYFNVFGSALRAVALYIQVRIK